MKQLSIIIVLIVILLVGCRTNRHPSEKVIPVTFEAYVAYPYDNYIPDKPLPDVSKMFVIGSVLLSNSDLESASVFESYDGKPVVQLLFDRPGTVTLSKITQEYKGKHLGLVIDGQLLAAPLVLDEIRSGIIRIPADYDLQESIRISEGINQWIGEEHNKTLERDAK